MDIRKGIITLVLTLGIILTGCSSANEYNGIKYKLEEKNTLIKNEELYLSRYNSNDKIMQFLTEKDLLPKTQTEFRLSGPSNKVVVRIYKGTVNGELSYRVENTQLKKELGNEDMQDDVYKVNNGSIEKISNDIVGLYGFEGDGDGKTDSILYDIAPMPKEIEASIEESIEEESGKVRFNIKTNLPNLAELMVEVKEINGDYIGQTKATVENGVAQTEWFSNRGTALTKGEYELSISMSNPSLQADEVQKKIGKKGEYLKGNLVKKGSDDSSYVSKTMVITLNTGVGVEAKAENNSKHKDLVSSLYSELIGEYKSQLSNYNEMEFKSFLADWNRRRNSTQDIIDNEGGTTDYKLAIRELNVLETEIKNKLLGRSYDENHIKSIIESIESIIK